jgi:hypothetical protein
MSSKTKYFLNESFLLLKPSEAKLIENEQINIYTSNEGEKRIWTVSKNWKTHIDSFIKYYYLSKFLPTQTLYPEQKLVINLEGSITGIASALDSRFTKIDYALVKGLTNTKNYDLFFLYETLFPYLTPKSEPIFGLVIEQNGITSIQVLEIYQYLKSSELHILEVVKNNRINLMTSPKLREEEYKCKNTQKSCTNDSCQITKNDKSIVHTAQKLKDYFKDKNIKEEIKQEFQKDILDELWYSKDINYIQKTIEIQESILDSTWGNTLEEFISLVENKIFESCQTNIEEL